MSNQTSNRILIVDDDSEFRRSLSKILQKAGYQVSTAASGMQIDEMMSKEVYPLVILDVHMPGKSGLEVLKEVKEKSPKTKVIMITVNSELYTYTEALNSGAFAFLTKPVKMKEILKYVSMALNSSQNSSISLFKRGREYHG